MYLYGASGHAKVIIDLLTAQGIDVLGLFDDNEGITELLGYPVYKTDKIESPIIISIGNNRIRKKIAENLNCKFATAVHPSAIISPFAQIDKGTVIMQQAVIQSSAKVGRHCIINTSSSVDHDCVLENYVHVSPNATLCGNVKVGEGSWVGAGSIIIPGITVGKWVTIGAGSVVINDIPDNVIAVGNPCKISKYINQL